MNEPIVNPWLVYVIMNWVSFFAPIIAGMIITFSFSLVSLCQNVQNDFDNWAWWRKKTQWAVGIFILGMFLLVFMPSKNTFIAIICAKEITYERLDKAVKGGKIIKEEIKKDFLEIMDELSKRKGQ